MQSGSIEKKAVPQVVQKISVFFLSLIACNFLWAAKPQIEFPDTPTADVQSSLAITGDLFLQQEEAANLDDADVFQWTYLGCTKDIDSCKLRASKNRARYYRAFPNTENCSRDLQVECWSKRGSSN